MTATTVRMKEIVGMRWSVECEETGISLTMHDSRKEAEAAAKEMSDYHGEKFVAVEVAVYAR